MSGIDLEITLQDAKFIAALLRSAGAQKQFTGELDKSKRAGQQAEQSLDRMAASVNRMNATPIQKYNAEVEKLDKLLAKAKISQDVHARATASAKTEYERATVAASQFGSVGKESASDVAASLGMVTTAAGTATAAVAIFTNALREARQQSKDAAGEMDKLFNVRRTLNQVAKSPEHLQQMMTRADNAAQKYGLPREKAHEIMADAVGSGFEKEYETVVAAHAGGVDAGKASGMAKKVLSIYKEKDPKLTAKSAIDMTLAAAKPSDLSFENLSSGVAQASEGGTSVGAKAEETIATLSVLGGQFASVETAADRMKGFGVKAGMDSRLKGKGMLGAMREIRDKFTEKDRKAFLGDSQELNVMYQKLKENEKAIEGRTKVVEQARVASDAGKGEVQHAVYRAQQTPQLRATIEKQRAENRLAIVKEQKLGVHGQSQEVGEANAEANALAGNRNFLYRSGSNAYAKGASFLGFSGKTVENAGGLGGVMANVGASNILMPFSGSITLLREAARLLMGSAKQQQEAATFQQEAAVDQKAAAKRRPPIHHAAQVEAAQQIN